MSKDLVHARRELPKTLTGRSWGALAPSTLRYFKDAGGPTPTPLLNSLFARYSFIKAWRAKIFAKIEWRYKQKPTGSKNNSLSE